MMPHVFRAPPPQAVQRLLGDCSLPAADLGIGQIEHFFGCGAEDAPQGVVGLELCGETALLRSLAVEPTIRGRGCGKALVARAEAYARQRGVRQLYLLTTTAAEFFSRLGYKAIARDQAPEAIRATSEFSTLCPVSSAFMMKEVGMATAKKAAGTARRKRR